MAENFGSVGSAWVDIKADFSGLDKGLQDAHNRVIGAATGMENSFGAMISSITSKLLALYVSFRVFDEVKEAAMLAARVETLGVVLDVVGKNAGYASYELSSYTEHVKKMGITTQEAEVNLTRMMQAHMDLSKSTDLARIAQDAAVIANTNSSQAFERLVLGIQRGQVEILRTLGINVMFDESYTKLAATLKKTTAELSEDEKVQARVNAVIEKGKDIAGSYENAMGTTGKQINSLARYIEEAKRLFGEMFNPALGVIVRALTVELERITKKFEEMKGTSDWTKIISTITGYVQMGVTFITDLIHTIIWAVGVAWEYRNVLLAVAVAVMGLRVATGITAISELAESMSSKHTIFTTFATGLNAIVDHLLRMKGAAKLAAEGIGTMAVSAASSGLGSATGSVVGTAAGSAAAKVVGGGIGAAESAGAGAAGAAGGVGVMQALTKLAPLLMNPWVDLGLLAAGGVALVTYGLLQMRDATLATARAREEYNASLKKMPLDNLNNELTILDSTKSYVQNLGSGFREAGNAVKDLDEKINAVAKTITDKMPQTSGAVYELAITLGKIKFGQALTPEAMGWKKPEEHWYEFWKKEPEKPDVNHMAEKDALKEIINLYHKIDEIKPKTMATEQEITKQKEYLGFLVEQRTKASSPAEIQDLDTKIKETQAKYDAAKNILKDISAQIAFYEQQIPKAEIAQVKQIESELAVTEKLIVGVKKRMAGGLGITIKELGEGPPAGGWKGKGTRGEELEKELQVYEDSKKKLEQDLNRIAGGGTAGAAGLNLRVKQVRDVFQVAQDLSGEAQERKRIDFKRETQYAAEKMQKELTSMERTEMATRIDEINKFYDKWKSVEGFDMEALNNWKRLSLQKYAKQELDWKLDYEKRVASMVYETQVLALTDHGKKLLDIEKVYHDQKETLQKLDIDRKTKDNNDDLAVYGKYWSRRTEQLLTYQKDLKKSYEEIRSEEDKRQKDMKFTADMEKQYREGKIRMMEFQVGRGEISQTTLEEAKMRSEQADVVSEIKASLSRLGSQLELWGKEKEVSELTQQLMIVKDAGINFDHTALTLKDTAVLSKQAADTLKEVVSLLRPTTKSPVELATPTITPAHNVSTVPALTPAHAQVVGVTGYDPSKPITTEIVDSFNSHIAQAESGTLGFNSPPNKSTGAFGKYGMMPIYWPEFSERAGIGKNAAKTPENQEKVMKYLSESHLREFGDERLAAIAHFLGPVVAKELAGGTFSSIYKTDQSGVSGVEYLKRAKLPEWSVFASDAYQYAHGRTPKKIAPLPTPTIEAAAVEEPVVEGERMKVGGGFDYYGDVWGEKIDAAKKEMELFIKDVNDVDFSDATVSLTDFLDRIMGMRKALKDIPTSQVSDVSKTELEGLAKLLPKYEQIFKIAQQRNIDTARAIALAKEEYDAKVKLSDIEDKYQRGLISEGRYLEEQINAKEQLLKYHEKEIARMKNTGNPDEAALIKEKNAYFDIEKQLRDLKRATDELNGSFAEGITKGLSDYYKSMKTQFQFAQSSVAETANVMKGTFSQMFTDIRTNKFAGIGEYFQSIADKMAKIWENMLAEMLTNWILTGNAMKVQGVSGASAAEGGLVGLAKSGISALYGYGKSLFSKQELMPVGGGYDYSQEYGGGGYDYYGTADYVPEAKGGVFSASGITAFASGGVINSPTVFPFAGGTGLMGEAGPEAIMPLVRNGQGELGVKTVAEMSSPQINASSVPSTKDAMTDLADSTKNVTDKAKDLCDSFVGLTQASKDAEAQSKRQYPEMSYNFSDKAAGWEGFAAMAISMVPMFLGAGKEAGKGGNEKIPQEKLAGTAWEGANMTKNEATMMNFHTGGFVYYHSGGEAGKLASDEVQAILQKDEFVVSRAGVQAATRMLGSSFLPMLNKGVEPYMPIREVVKPMGKTSTTNNLTIDAPVSLNALGKIKSSDIADLQEVLETTMDKWARRRL
jgi:hypothetical protein